MKKRIPLYIQYWAIFSSILLLLMLLGLMVNLFITKDAEMQSFLAKNMVRTLSILIPIEFILIGIFSWIVIKPIKTLSKNVQQVAKGKFDTPMIMQTKHTDEITDLVENFNIMIRELSKNEYLHKEFVSNVSHEFKTPLAAIRGYTEMMALPELSDEKRLQYADTIMVHVDRLSRLSNDLLRLSELENKTILSNKTRFSVTEQVRDALILLQNKWETKALAIEFDAPELFYEGDRALLYHVWVNILDNAIKYTPDCGTITITLQQSDVLTISIADTGIGMTAEQQARVFDRFYKADKARSSHSSGLGLAIAKKIIEIHDGTITLKSEENIGTTMIVTLT